MPSITPPTAQPGSSGLQSSGTAQQVLNRAFQIPRASAGDSARLLAESFNALQNYSNGKSSKTNKKGKHPARASTGRFVSPFVNQEKKRPIEPVYKNV